MGRKTTRVNESEVVCNSIIGKTEELAKDLANSSGYSLRVTKNDEENYMVTMDFRLDRINVHIKNGIVTESRIG